MKAIRFPVGSPFSTVVKGEQTSEQEVMSCSLIHMVYLSSVINQFNCLHIGRL
jgi:hypothetical protein